MTIKMGTHQTVFDTVNILIKQKGMTVKQAIAEVEAILGDLPEDIKDRIYQECG